MEGWEKRTMWKVHPYNLCLLSAMIDKEYDVKIIDANLDNLSQQEFAEIIKHEKPDVLGISVLANEYSEACLITAKIVKEVDASIKIVVGGVFAILNSESLIKDQNIDYVIMGEGEHVFKSLIEFFDGKGNLPPNGVLYKENEKVINTGKADFIDDLDNLPLPSYHKINFLEYANIIQRESVDGPRALPYAHILTSRGCPYNCCFCSVGLISGKKNKDEES